MPKHSLGIQIFTIWLSFVLGFIIWCIEHSPVVYQVVQRILREFHAANAQFVPLMHLHWIK